MDIYSVLTGGEKYCSDRNEECAKIQLKSKMLCHKFNLTSPDEGEKRREIMSELFGTYNPDVFIEPSFHCDYGFNIHFAGFALINYNCAILDTSPVHIGKNAFIAPNVCISCAGHALDAEQRRSGVNTSAPITIGDDVWIGANSTILGGVSIGSGSVIGAGSVVTGDIPDGVVAVGSPCRVMRKITEDDRIDPSVLV